jgi:hypothetical protein
MVMGHGIYASKNLQVPPSHAWEQRRHGAPRGVPVVQPAREHHVRSREAVHAGGPEPAPVAHQGHDALAAAAGRGRPCGGARVLGAEGPSQRRHHRVRPGAAGRAGAGRVGHGRARPYDDGGCGARAAHGDGLLRRRRRQRRQADGQKRHRRVPAVDGRAEAVQQAPPAAHPEAPVLGHDVAHRGAGLRQSPPGVTSPLNRSNRRVGIRITSDNEPSFNS